MCSREGGEAIGEEESGFGPLYDDVTENKLFGNALGDISQSRSLLEHFAHFL